MSEPTFEVRWGAATDVGVVRTHNEDGFLAAPPIFVVADGMGGQTRGSAASSAVIEEFRGLASAATVQPEQIDDAVSRAATAVAWLGDESSAPGSTVTGVGMTIEHDVPYWLVFNIGDSRTYLLQDGTLEQVTVDHSLVQELIATGSITPAQARVHPDRNVITNALGAGRESAPRADQWLLPARSGQRVVLCSDGLHGELSESLIAATLLAVDDPQRAATELVASAVRAGGHDNVTVVVVDAVTVSAGTTEVVDETHEIAQTVPNPIVGQGDR